MNNHEQPERRPEGKGWERTRKVQIPYRLTTHSVVANRTQNKLQKQAGRRDKGTSIRQMAPNGSKV